jgi:hypothetical protein
MIQELGVVNVMEKARSRIQRERGQQELQGNR